MLAALADPARGRIDGRVAVVLAHQDDETIGLGAQLSRFTDLVVVHVTDGAPADMKDAHSLGLSHRDDYAALRRREVEAALAIAGVAPEAHVDFAIQDQEVARNMPAITRRLATFLSSRAIEIVFTHAYEGGHIDHDATAFCVHAACELISPGKTPAIIDMPFYHRGFLGYTTQAFAPKPRAPHTRVRLGKAEIALKQRMIAAHASQAGVLAKFKKPVELFREAPPYDFSAPANGGRLFFPDISPQYTAQGFADLVRAAEADLKDAA